MNVYIVSEGMGEVAVYRKWVPLVNPALAYVSNVFEMKGNNFSIVAGGGYPNYFDVVSAALEDVNEAANIDRVVVSVDSEDMSREEKSHEMRSVLEGKECSAEIFVVVQHFCLETWALGNKRVGPRNPGSRRLREYKAIFNVLSDDPERLPPVPQEDLNRAQFAERYLREMLLDKHRNLTYTKSNPRALLHEGCCHRRQLR